MAQDPLRQFMNMADDVRRNIDSMISQGTRQIKTTLPQLPFPGAGGGAPELPTGPQELLAKLPKLPEIPGLPTPAIPAAKKMATPKFLSGGPRVEVHPEEWHNSHTLSPGELASLRAPLQKNGVPTSTTRPRVLSK